MEPTWSYELVPTEANVEPPDLVVSCFDVADLNGVMTSDFKMLHRWISQTGTAPRRDSDWFQRIEREARKMGDVVDACGIEDEESLQIPEVKARTRIYGDLWD